MVFGSNSLHFDAVQLARLFSRRSIRRFEYSCKVLCLLCLAGCVFALIYYAMISYLDSIHIGDQLTNDIAAVIAPSKPSDEQIKAEPLTESSDAGYIVTRQLFGELGTKPPPAQATAKPVSNIALILIGTFTAKGQAPYAIVEDQKKSTQDVFMLNDSIFGEATLKKIGPDSIEIERNGQREVLNLDDMPSASSSSVSTSSSGASDTVVVDESELDKALENLPLLLTQARAVPYFKDGKSVGLRLFAIRSGSLFEKIGLLNGDILKTINGNSLADFSQAMSLFQKLKEERSISLSLERNGQEKEFKYDIK